MSILEIPGARLYYEVRGSGPVMMMTHGALGSADVFTSVTARLAKHYSIVTYDRRGYARSALVGPQDDDRLKTDADDVWRLLTHLGEEPATVFGSSAGGLVALEVLARHPGVVATLALHEPAAVTQLPDGGQVMDLVYGLYDLYRRAGIEPALEKFRTQLFPESDQQAAVRAVDPANGATYWFEHELRQYIAAEFDLDALGAHADRIVLVVGRETRGYPTYRANVELGKKLGRDVIELSGGHFGYLTHPAEFARELVQALGGTTGGPKR